MRKGERCEVNVSQVCVLNITHHSAGGGDRLWYQNQYNMTSSWDVRVFRKNQRISRPVILIKVNVQTNQQKLELGVFGGARNATGRGRGNCKLPTWKSPWRTYTGLVVQKVKIPDIIWKLGTKGNGRVSGDMCKYVSSENLQKLCMRNVSFWGYRDQLGKIKRPSGSSQCKYIECMKIAPTKSKITFRSASIVLMRILPSSLWWPRRHL